MKSTGWKMPHRNYKIKFEPDNARGCGRRLANPKVITYCDFGDTGRKSEIGRHATLATAMRQYARLWESYSRINKWRVWQEYQQ